MSTLPDPYREAEAAEWHILNGAKAGSEKLPNFDFVVIGSGAGGATAAKVLAEAGHRVAILEEGSLRTSSDFNLRESEAYAQLYQEGLTRVASQGAISILQGRTVGGSTTINWASSFRAPEQTLNHWKQVYGLEGYGQKDLAPIFQRVEEELSIKPWESPNAGNAILRDGCSRLGFAWKYIPRNVRGCWNLGYCGMGCPTNAKQSMLVTHIPATLRRGGTLIHNLRAERLIWSGDKVSAVDCSIPGSPTSSVRVPGKNFILSSGAIGSPGLLMRSAIPDPHSLVGKRTFLHVTIFSFAQSKEPTHPYHGAPQSVYSDHFQWLNGVQGPMGFKMEAAPLHPILTAGLLPTLGREHLEYMEKLPYTSAIIALMRDGFHEESPGGTLSLDSQGREYLHYPFSDYLSDGLRRALLTMAEIQFAAGCTAVAPAHADAAFYKDWEQARTAIPKLPMAMHRPKLGSAHVMGGCPMGGDARLSVVDNNGRHRQMANLHVIDASIFPTSLGTNPQLTIYALAEKIARNLAHD